MIYTRGTELLCTRHGSENIFHFRIERAYQPEIYVFVELCLSSNKVEPVFLYNFKKLFSFSALKNTHFRVF